MSMRLALNLTLFQRLNAPAGLSGAGLWVAAFHAEGLIAAAAGWPRAPGRARRLSVTGLLVAAALTGWARVLLGVHFPLDIAGAFAIAACCAAVATSAFTRPLLAAVAVRAEQLYRRLLAYPFAHGWLNP
ncbi:phosphatase PAP2 family protein [Cupriavidus basilensis]|nr:phosphatase PAP2 family protein [Cupriavidus basilensis]